MKATKAQMRMMAAMEETAAAYSDLAKACEAIDELAAAYTALAEAHPELVEADEEED